MVDPAHGDHGGAYAIRRLGRDGGPVFWPEHEEARPQQRDGRAVAQEVRVGKAVYYALYRAIDAAEIVETCDRRHGTAEHFEIRRTGGIRIDDRKRGLRSAHARDRVLDVVHSPHFGGKPLARKPGFGERGTSGGIVEAEKHGLRPFAAQSRRERDAAPQMPERNLGGGVGAKGDDRCRHDSG